MKQSSETKATRERLKEMLKLRQESLHVQCQPMQEADVRTRRIYCVDGALGLTTKLKTSSSQLNRKVSSPGTIDTMFHTM